MTTFPTDYRPLVNELVERATAHRQPVDGTFELTERCNLSCRMCYIRHSAGSVASRKKELSTSAWLMLTREAVDNGMVFLLLTGGEVFLRPDFFEIYTPLTRLGLILTVFTNGTLITDAVAQRLAQAPPSRIEITLYGATAATYEAVTGIPGSYARCCAGIEALVKHSVPLRLKTTITQQNASEFETMRQMANNWSVSFYASWLLSRRTDCNHSDVEHCRLSAQDGVILESHDYTADKWTDVYAHKLVNKQCFHCAAGKAAFIVTSSGEMNVCSVLTQPVARPLDIGFSAAWEQVRRFVDDVPPLAPACLACNARVYCPCCPAWSWLETRTLTEPVPYLCEIARMRQDRYGGT